MPAKKRKKRVSEARPAAEWPDPGPAAPRAKLFWNGRSQAVRLPKEFRFAGDEVSIRRVGNQVVLEPVSGSPRRPGGWERGVWIAPDFDEPLPPDVVRGFRGTEP